MASDRALGIVNSAKPQTWSGHPFVARLARVIKLSNDDLDGLWQLLEAETTVPKRRDLVIDGYEFRKLGLVEEGFAARYKLLRNGKRQIINFVLPGDIVGLSGSFVEKARYSVITLTRLKMQVCPIGAYVRLCYERPQFGLALSWLAVEESIICAEHAISTGRRTPAERLAHLLLELHSRLAAVGRASATGFHLPLSQEIISDALGLSVPHLNRTLGELRASGLIALEGRNIELVDRPSLEVMAQFQPIKLAPIDPGGRNQT